MRWVPGCDAHRWADLDCLACLAEMARDRAVRFSALADGAGRVLSALLRFGGLSAHYVAADEPYQHLHAASSEEYLTAREFRARAAVAAVAS